MTEEGHGLLIKKGALLLQFGRDEPGRAELPSRRCWWGFYVLCKSPWFNGKEGTFISSSWSSSASGLVRGSHPLSRSPLPWHHDGHPHWINLQRELPVFPVPPPHSSNCPQLQHSSIHATDPKSCHYFLVAWMDGDPTGPF